MIKFYHTAGSAGTSHMKDECWILHLEKKKTIDNLEEETQQDQQRRMRNGKCVVNRKWILTTRVFTLTKDIEQPDGEVNDINKK